MHNIGLLEVDAKAMRDWLPQLQMPQEGTVCYGVTEDLLDKYPALRELLNFPEGYSVKRMFFDVLRLSWWLHVEHASFPEPVPGEMLPRLEVIYTVDELRHPHILSIALCKDSAYA